jgi:hypothetical protein
VKDVVGVYNYHYGIEAVYFDGELYIQNCGDEAGNELFLEVAQDLTRDGPVRLSAPWFIKDEFCEGIQKRGFPKNFKNLVHKLDQRL